MKQSELMKIVGLLAESGNETRKALGDILGYTDREFAALVASIAEVKAIAEKNGERLQDMDEAKVIKMAQTLAKELADLGIDGEALSELLEKIRSNELKLTSAVAKLEQLEARANAADEDRKTIKSTQVDHGRRITALEAREDKVGQSEEEVNQQIGGALQALANGLGALSLQYGAPVTGLDYTANGFVRRAQMPEAVADSSSGSEFSDA